MLGSNQGDGMQGVCLQRLGSDSLCGLIWQCNLLKWYIISHMINSKIIVILTGLVILLGGSFLIFNKKGNDLKSVETNTQTEETNEITIPTTKPSIATENEKSNIVPLPQEEDIIRAFFALINEKRIPDAIAMMNPVFAGDDSSRQTWGVHFNAIKKIEVKSIEPGMKDDWSENSHVYKVMLDVSMKPEAVNAPIPNYGWDEGSNIRWVSLEKISSVWTISGIATGP